MLETTSGPIHALEECVDHPYFSTIFGNTPPPGIKASSAKAAIIPVTLQARAMATPNAWDDLGPVTFRTERPETAVREIDPRSEAITTKTTMGRETSTYVTSMTTTAEVDVMSVIIIPDTTSTVRTRNNSRKSSTLTPSVASTAQPTVTAVVVVNDPQSTTTVVVFAPETTATEVVLAPETTATAAPRPITTAAPRPITTAAPRPIRTSTLSASTAPVPAGTPITTISNIMPGRNTVQLPSQSAAPVIVINAPEESYSTVRTTETLWSSVWQPINIAISTRTRDLKLVMPPTHAPGSSGKSSGASTTRSGAGVIVMAGIGALAACFMMF
ncbi:hypothetical protein QBC32DRAFT_404647 [Pseudoneurospora amorphoporcata]|uniref:Uncharacterized protein n=1 Tax=Pseudoneurospora amorphoporcata TaxID=241081 RepID=A0AAN6NXI3_9PEZI|nr:hypothetical protein QBC32DRAFT_404647 [Pseudoneurospora amorphoporcata]